MLFPNAVAEERGKHIHKQEAIFWAHQQSPEPTSVLDRLPSPSPSPPFATITTLSSSNKSDVAALASNKSPQPQPPPPPPPNSWHHHSQEPGSHDEWAQQLQQPITSALDMAGADTWDPSATGTTTHEPTFLRWIMGSDAGEDQANLGLGLMDPPGLDFDHIGPFVSHPLPPPPSLGPTNLLLQPHSAATPSFFGPMASPFGAEPTPPLKRHQPMAGYGMSPQIMPKLAPPMQMGSGYLHSQQQQQLARPMKPKAEAGGDDSAYVVQLLEAAKAADAGDGYGAREILARLNFNYRLPNATATGTPLLRSAFYFKEALQLALSGDTVSSAAAMSPLDVVVKISAFKAFADVSPVPQFVHFTCVQALLDELGGSNCVHVVDFDIGFGVQWAALMQELAHKRGGNAGVSAVTALKVTAFVTHSSHHPLELQLIHDNLANFAAELNIAFQFNILSLDNFDPSELFSMTGNEAVAVNIPVGAANTTALPCILRLVKQLRPKIVLSIDHGCDRGEMAFAAQFSQAFQSCVFLLDSIDAAGTDPELANKIERFLIQPRIENSVLGRHRAATDKLMPWRTIFASAGFAPTQVSNFAEAQAECLLKRMPVRGFRVEKHLGSLSLYWHRGELVSVSAWRC